MNRKSFSKKRLMVYGWLIGLLIFAGGFQLTHQASASPTQPAPKVRVAMISETGKVVRVQLLSNASHAGVASTAVATTKYCITGDARQFAAQLTLSGTLTGSAPTLIVKLQDSIDGGVTWTDVNTFTTINATVTPAAQRIAFSDVAASTAITFGDCYRVSYTFTGTGTLSGVVGVSLLAK